MKCAIYRLFNDSGELLYVGVSNKPANRIASHKDKGWFNEIAKSEIQWLESRKVAIEEENKAIKIESPKHNITSSLINDSASGISAKNRKPISEIRQRNLAYLVEESGLSIKTFADNCGLNRSHLSQMLNGFRDVGNSVVLRVQNSLDLDFGYMDTPRDYRKSTSRISIPKESVSDYSIFDFAQGKPGISPLATHCTDAWEPRHSLGGA